MNEKIAPGQSIASISPDITTVINRISLQALSSRGKKEVTYRPYRKIPGVNFERPLSFCTVDFAQVYPQAQEGDEACCDFFIFCSETADIYLNISSNAHAFFNQDLVHEAEECDDDTRHILIHVVKDCDNHVRLKCKKKDGKFSIRFLLSVTRYPFMWANDYLFYARAVLPEPSAHYEEGVKISPLFRNGIALPEKNNRDELTQEFFDFNKLCDGGRFCYVYTEAFRNGMLSCDGDIQQVYINGKGRAITGESIPVCSGDRILIAVEKRESWRLQIASDVIGLSWLSCTKQENRRTLFIGAFEEPLSNPEQINLPSPEIYRDALGNAVYWKFCDGAYLRVYLDSIFFGQWFYALMVGFYGIRRIGELLQNAECAHYFSNNMEFMAHYFRYIQYEIERFGMPTFMPRIGEPDVLDNLGTMGMNFIDAYFMNQNHEILPVVEHIAAHVMENVPRFPDGTFFREETMWADDLYMSCPFLVRMYRLTGEEKWFDEALRQVAGFKERLYIEDKHLFSHIFFVESGHANHVPWGRGNGWIMWTLSEILLHAPKHQNTTNILKLFQEMAESLKYYQSDVGLWRQVIDAPEEGSYLETSCTGMFMIAMIRGMKNGWLDNSYMQCVEKAWKGLTEHAIAENGDVYGVCMGSGCADEKEYYYTIPTTMNDDHGVGVILTALAEYDELIREGR